MPLRRRHAIRPPTASSEDPVDVEIWKEDALLGHEIHAGNVVVAVAEAHSQVEDLPREDGAHRKRPRISKVDRIALAGHVKLDRREVVGMEDGVAGGGNALKDQVAQLE